MVVLVAQPEAERPLREALAAAGFVFETRPHARFMARGPGATVTFYKSGKVLVTGKSDKLVGKRLLELAGVQPLTPATPLSTGVASAFVPRVGVDESGKGDYFGPLVVAAVAIEDAATEKHLREEGVRDSKSLTSAHVQRLDALVRRHTAFDVVTINPEAYNRLHGEMKNLNELLAWGHARALENVLEKKPLGVAISDQFGDKRLVETALLERGRQVRLEQRHRAESDAAVAAASVLARAEFVRRLEALATEWQQELPKGAGPEVIRAARVFVKRHGREQLGKVAKLHFRTTIAL